MFSTSDDAILHGYSVIQISLDDDRDDTVPVGVVAWDDTRSWYGWRWLASDERVRGINASTRRFMQVTKKQLVRWAESQRVPYEPSPVEPTSARFWRAVSAVLSTAVRVDAPRAMVPMMEPEEDIEALFEAIVRPIQSSKKQHERIDGVISRALGSVANRFPTNPEVLAFGKVKERVRRGSVTEKGAVLIEGVNLATADARKDADALVSRLRRIKVAYCEHSTFQIIVGYASSPGGLNGEAHMRDWICEELDTQVFDLSLQQREFQRAAAAAWRRLAEPVQGTLSLVQTADEVPDRMFQRWRTSARESRLLGKGQPNLETEGP